MGRHSGPVDSWPPMVRHLVFALVPVVLGWLGSDLVPFLPPLYAGLVAAGLQQVVLYVTPLTKQYGVGEADYKS